jgi:hypothetical protein
LHVTSPIETRARLDENLIRSKQNPKARKGKRGIPRYAMNSKSGFVGPNLSPVILSRHYQNEERTSVFKRIIGMPSSA